MVESFKLPEGALPEKQDSKERTFERKERLLEELHRSAVLGLKLINYVETTPNPSWELFRENATQGQEISKQTEEFFRGVIEKWHQSRASVDALFQDMQQALAQENTPATPERLIIKLFQLRGCPPPVGAVRLVPRGAYLGIICENQEDYRSLYSGAPREATTSRGTYHRSFDLALKEAVPVSEEKLLAAAAWNEDSDEPPPDLEETVTLKSWSIPILLVRGTDEVQIQKTFIHEQQHLISDLFANIYRRSSEETSRWYYVVPDEKKAERSDIAFQDEILSGIREGSSGEYICRRLGKKRSESYKKFINASPEQLEKQDTIVNQIRTALDEPVTSALFVSLEMRTVLALQLLHVPVERIAHRIQVLREFYTQRLPLPLIENKEEDLPQNLNVLAQDASEERRAFCDEQEKTVRTTFKTYQDAVRDFLLDQENPERRATFIGAVKEYFIQRDIFLQKVHSH